MQSAAEMLKVEFPGIYFSSVYRTKARDREDQADFLNAVAAFESNASPEDVQEKLRAIEQALKKNPPYPKGPRTIDLDFLLYGNTVMETPALTIPHPRMHERRFVLEPLMELLQPDTLHPTLRTSWSAIMGKTLAQKCEKTAIQL